MSESSTQQADITRWFDETYANKGARYLRPLAAYRVMPLLMQLEPQHSLLDVACGLGLMLQAGSECGASVSGVDISSMAAQGAAARVPEAQVARAPAESLPFSDHSFDRLSCLGSLERMLQPDVALHEMRRVLTPSGKALIMVRNSKTLTWSIKSKLGLVNQQGHQGADTLENWRHRLLQAGLQIEAIHYDQWPLFRWQYWLGRYLGWVPRTRIRRGPLPIRYANEFIFVCSVC